LLQDGQRLGGRLGAVLNCGRLHAHSVPPAQGAGVGSEVRMATQAIADRRSVAKRRTIRRIPLVRYLLLCVLSLLWAAPVVWMFLTSVKPEAQIIRVPPRWLPDQLSDFTIQHYIDV